MDTLSRKHRLRQQQQQQQLLQLQQEKQQQVQYGCRESQRWQVVEEQQLEQSNHQRRKASSGGHKGNRNNNNNNHIEVQGHANREDEDGDGDDGEFKVYQVNHAAHNNHRQQVNEQYGYGDAGWPHVVASDSLNPQVSRLDCRPQYDHDGHNNDYHQPRDVSTTRAYGDKSQLSPYYTRANDCSPGDSSGFQSDHSRTTQLSIGTSAVHRQLSDTSPRSYQKGNAQRRVRRSDEPATSGCGLARQRSLVLDELDKLQLFQRDLASSSPTESHVSTCASSTLTRTLTRGGDSTLIRGIERGYSVQCRDEFSHYIPINTEDQTQLPVSSPPLHRAGPSLVGVHQEFYERPGAWTENHDTSLTQSTSSPDELYDAATSPRFQPSADHSPTDFGQVVQTCAETWDLSSLEKYNDLGDMIDIYLGKMVCLIRLASGEQESISIEDAFGDGEEIDVSAELRTRIAVKPLDDAARRTTSIVQEYQVVETMPNTNCDDGVTKATREQSTSNRTFNTTIVSGGNFSSEEKIPCSQDSEPHICDLIELDWGKAELAMPTIEEIILREAESIGRKQPMLQDSLLQRLSGDDDLMMRASCKGQRRGSVDLVSTVKGHLSEFLNDYLDYQAEFKRNTTFATGWRENWLFASRWQSAGDRDSWPAMKRTKLDNESDDTSSSDTRRMIDLLKYSTLTLIKFTPIKLTHSKSGGMLTDDGEIETIYGAQLEAFEEVQARLAELFGCADVCRQLLRIDDDEDCVASGAIRKDAKNQKFRWLQLRVTYSSSTVKLASDSFNFTACGYLFELPHLHRARVPKSKQSLLKEKILNKFVELTVKSLQGVSEPIAAARAEDRVRFLVELSDVKLVNRLPVIQFCAKISGAMPICVKWYRSVVNRGAKDGKDEVEFEEMSDVSDSKRRQNLRLRRRPSAIATWPVTMQSNYDYEYQTGWNSWFRFVRSGGDIMFELRNADDAIDYNTTYKCLIGNFCSRQECQFSLTRNEVVTCDANNATTDAAIRRPIRGGGQNKSKSGEKDGHALLRSWSQRTLHRPAPVVVIGDSDSATTAATKTSSTRTTGAAGCATIPDPLRATGTSEKLASSGQLNSLTATCSRLLGSRDDHDGGCDEGMVNKGGEADKFGQDFPYHPKNLLKRLEENKYLCVQSLKKSKLAGEELPTMASGFATQPPLRQDHDLESPQSRLNFVQATNYNDMPISESMDFFEPIEVEPQAGSTTTAANHKNLDENENELLLQKRQSEQPQAFATSTYTRVSRRALQTLDNNNGHGANDQRQAEIGSGGGGSVQSAEQRPAQVAAVPKPRSRLKQNQESASDGDTYNRSMPVGGRPELRSGGQQSLICKQQSLPPSETTRLTGKQKSSAVTVTEATTSEINNDTRMDSTTGAKSIVQSATSNEGPGKRFESCRSFGLTRSANSELAAPSDECKPKTNVKSLISRFSLA